MMLSSILRELSINISTLKDVDVIDGEFVWTTQIIWSTQGQQSVSIIYRTLTEVCGFTAIDIPIHTCIEHRDLTLAHVKAREQTLLVQLDWYNKLKPVLTNAVKKSVPIDQLPVSIDQLIMICEHYKQYRINGTNLVKA